MNITTETNKAENSDYQLGPLAIAAATATKIGTFFVTNKFIGNIKIPGTKIQDLRYLSLQFVNKSPWNMALGKDKNAAYSVRELILNGIKGMEEQLFKVPRVFSAYNLYSEGYLSQEINRIGSIFVPAEQLALQANYLKSISKGKITSDMLRDGLTVRGAGGAFDSLELVHDIDGANPSVVLKNAKVMFADWASEIDRHAYEVAKASGSKVSPRLGYSSKFFQTSQIMHGGTVPKIGPELQIRGGQTLFQDAFEKVSTIFSAGVHNYMKLADNPFEALLSPLESVFGSNTSVPNFLKKGSKFWEAAGLKDLLGVGGWKQVITSKGTGALLKQHALRALPILGLGIAAYKVIDETLRGTPIIKDTRLGGGLSGTAASLYQDASMGYATFSNLTGLTKLSKLQEEKAPGSTNLSAVAALPISLAIAGGTAAKTQDWMERMPVLNKTVAPDRYLNTIAKIESKGNLLSSISKHLKLADRGRVGAYAITGAAAGLIASLPFLAGAIGSKKTPEELQKVYSGEELQEVKQGRNWITGITPYEGDGIKHFAPHWTVQAITDAAKRSKLGRLYGNPLLRMARRIADPYVVERETDKDRPYVYWGPSDHGMGVFEKLSYPVKEIFKPTIVAHPEALGLDHPSRLKRGKDIVPESLKGTKYDNTLNAPPLPEAPNTKKTWLREGIGSIKDTMGLIGFGYGSTLDKMAKGQSSLSSDAIYESSGRILSAQRAYWDKGLGDMALSSEFIRRLNPQRDYGPEYVQGAIRNTQPEWMNESSKYGDPYSAIESGELRLPGRGYIQLHPELKGVNPEDYPAAYRMAILHDTARMTPEYYRAKAQVETDMANGDINDKGLRLYQETLRQEELQKQDETGNFDNGDRGLVNSYWYGLKRLGKGLPTEHLYPLAPAHKFMGPVDAISEYRSKEVVDKPFKVWSNPVADYIKPAYNQTMSITTGGNFIPQETKERRDINNQFELMQHGKNALLREEAKQYSDAGDYEASAFIKSGIKKTAYDYTRFADLEEHAGQIQPRERKYFRQFSETSGRNRSEAYKLSDPIMKEMLSGQWQKDDMMNAVQNEELFEMERHAEKIGGNTNPLAMMDSGRLPDRDFIGYAPGVNLNAFKVKVVSQLGKNIRDHNLWKEDERQARLSDSLARGISLSSPTAAVQSVNREVQKKQVSNILNSSGFTGARVSAIPIAGRSVVEFNGSNNNERAIHKQMRDDGYVTI